ncbi:ParB-like nuclease domain-containing protein [Dactylosporangium roseum]|uniref:ParB-like nuclease domain-containing protein n=1 Tax=Dactylosporangium roseum TaxID=47989 RepID=A0ABY5Z7I2_9ACTN|nr:ParB/RepB/Spo0J family partition protein [Dactylosporangium roseum]UWZ37802.1 ParB-like nuclease domain-containing protein [Dactylosporangium roseum]
MDLIGQQLVERASALFAELDQIPEAERIDVINEVRLALREHSPMQREPVDCVLWVDADQVAGNEYNPNVVAKPEMDLLKLSIMSDGFTQPIVAWPVDDGAFEVVDGFHRHRIGKEVGAITKRVRGRLPVSVINAERTAKEDRVAATIRHNRARGVHQVDAMSEIVVDLARRNWSDEKIGKELGMEPDEVLRLKQVTGLAELFADRGFSEAWEAEPQESHRRTTRTVVRRR